MADTILYVADSVTSPRTVYRFHDGYELLHLDDLGHDIALLAGVTEPPAENPGGKDNPIQPVILKAFKVINGPHKTTGL